MFESAYNVQGDTELKLYIHNVIQFSKYYLEGTKIYPFYRRKLRYRNELAPKHTAGK